MMGEAASDRTAGDPREILRELRARARIAAASAPGVREKAHGRRHELRVMLAALTLDDDLLDALREHLAHVATRIERLESDTARPAAAAAEILELRGDLTWLPLLLTENPLDETVAGLTAEIASLETTAAEIAEEDGGAARAAIAGARADLARVLTDRMEIRAKQRLADPQTDLERLWSVYLEARDLSLAGQDTKEILGALQKQVTERARALPPTETAETLSHFSSEYEDRALDLLAAESEQRPAAAAEALDRGVRELTWLRGVLRTEMKQVEGRSEAEQTAYETLRYRERRIGKACRRMSREGQEVRLQSRLEEIFGARFVAFFENLILWLIVGVLAVLVFEGLIPEQHPGPGASAEAIRDAASWRLVHRILVWTDAGICGIFLLEFLTKLALVRGKFSWFLRHFLVDLVPSIPYGLIAAHALDYARAGRMARFARIPRLIRYVRVARPIVRFFRFFGFLQRGMDRLVRLHGNLLNRSVIVFEPEPLTSTDSGTGALRARIRELRALSRGAWRRLDVERPGAERSADLRSFLAGMPGPEQVRGLPGSPPRRGESTKLLRAEELVDQLTNLDPGTVEAELGEGGARRFATTLDRIDVPIVRMFPGLRQMVRAARDGEPLERVVRAGKALGRWLQGLLGTVTWFSDLSGVISGPQFLDRLGSTMVNATARPAKRLLIFGLGFLLLNGIVELAWDVPEFRKDIDGNIYLLHEEGGRWHLDEVGNRVRYDPPALVSITAWFERVLGTPFLVLGSGCLVFLLTGMWFKRVAGEATDFYTRTAEAQYINLLKSAKLANLEEDISILWSRVLRPEGLVRSRDPEDGAARLLRRFRQETVDAENGSWREKTLQLYRDYLDGALFHSSDTKTTSQLLGNLALENIRTERLRTDRRERRRLGELDLDRERSALRGPYLWFRSINHSVAQWTAKLLLDYNRHAIPLAERPDYPDHVVEAHDAWLTRRLRGERVEEELEKSSDLSSFVTTEFTALHFLTADEARDAVVRARFGDATLAALQTDRQAMIRTIFGTYPFHRLPRPDRTMNPFDLYGRYLAGGRAALIPFYAVRIVFRGLAWLIRRIRQTLREIMNPTRFERDRAENWASYDVGVRKINRMRKPLFMECARFRATFDPEYMGLSLFPEKESGVEGRTFREDVESIGAHDEEWDFFHAMREGHSDALRELGRSLESAGGPRNFIEELRGPGRSATWRESHRAAAIAWTIDYRDARTLAGLRETAENRIREAVELRGKVPGAGPARRFLRMFLPSKGLRRAWREFLVRYGPHDLGRRELRFAWRALRADYGDLIRLVRLGASLEPGTSPEDASREILRGVARHPESWTEQLVTLRTVQSLSVLDVRNYRRQIRELGGYENE